MAHSVARSYFKLFAVNHPRHVAHEHAGLELLVIVGVQTLLADKLSAGVACQPSAVYLGSSVCRT